MLNLFILLRGNTICYIPEKATIHGNITSDSPVHIHGTVYGNIHCTAKLIIGKSGIVNGNIEATELKTDGIINGNSFITFGASAGKESVINGNIDASPLLLEDGASIAPQENLKEKEARPVTDDPSNLIMEKNSVEIARWF